MQNYIKLFHSFKEWEWYKDQNTKGLYIHLILSASTTDRIYQGIEIKRGQLITGRKVLAAQLGLSERQIRTSIEKLQTTNKVTSKATNKFTLLTIVNYDEFKSEDEEATNKTPTQRPTNDHSISITNNISRTNLTKTSSRTILDYSRELKEKEKKIEKKEKEKPIHEQEPDVTPDMFQQAGKGYRLTTKFELPMAWGVWAEGEGLLRERIIKEAESFKEYFTSGNAAKPIKQDWRAAWRGWIRRVTNQI